MINGNLIKIMTKIEIKDNGTYISNTEVILLTDKILNNNGWIYNDGNSKFFPETWQGRCMLAEDDEGYRFVVTSDYDDEDTNNTPIKIKYVHELQILLILMHKNPKIVL